MAERESDGKRKRQTDRDTERETERQRERQTETETERTVRFKLLQSKQTSVT